SLGSKKLKIFGIVSLLIVLSLTTSSVGAAKRTLSWGFVPQFDSMQTLKQWGPLIKELENNIPISIEVKTYKTFQEFSSELKSGVLDIVYVNPHQVLIAKQSMGYLPIIHDEKKKLQGILVVRKDSHFQSVDELNGKTVAFPALVAFGASTYLRAMLKEDHNIDIAPFFAGSHKNSYRSVLLGKAAAGGGVYKTFLAESQAFQEQFRVLYETPKVQPHAIIVHPRIGNELSEIIAENIIKLRESERGQKALKFSPIQNPERSNYRKHYSKLEKLGLDKYLSRE
ncbi:MAG: phosphate/phosphite/phosphonate ABC transporter substrate-binding protein, partial [Gammaproteobacteria bacterium]|nr:phosphate/phosphite/phosphonate ABC transporter substrate-binding protein [Gammaproteobacteria bacterium]